VAREAIEAYAEDTNAHPVGTGPYMLTEWKRSNKIVLEANPSFRGIRWEFAPSDDPLDKERIAAMAGKTMPQIGRVEISIIEEQQAAWLAFQNNELDILYLREQFAPVALPNNQVNADLAARGVTLSRTTDPDINYTYINTTDPEFGGFATDKIALRRAIFMSFDNAEYIRSSARGRRSTKPIRSRPASSATIRPIGRSSRTIRSWRTSCSIISATSAATTATARGRMASRWSGATRRRPRRATGRSTSSGRNRSSA
jgi:ABC-type dipeptide transport system, periplasmic component